MGDTMGFNQNGIQKTNTENWPEHFRSSSRVELPVEFLQSFAIDVRVVLRRANIRVAEQFLHRAQIGAAGQEMRGETVPKGVRADLRVQARTEDVFLDENPEHLAGVPFASLTDEDPRFLLVPLREQRP